MKIDGFYWVESSSFIGSKSFSLINKLPLAYEIIEYCPVICPNNRGL